MRYSERGVSRSQKLEASKQIKNNCVTSKNNIANEDYKIIRIEKLDSNKDETDNALNDDFIKLQEQIQKLKRLNIRLAH